MVSRRAKAFAVSAVALLLLAATVAFAASSAPRASTAAAPAAPKKKASTPRALRFACARNLYNARKVLRFVARGSQCKGSGKTLVNFSKDYPVYTCRKEHGGFAARQRRFQFPDGIRGHGPAGLMRLVDDPSKCAPGSQPNETPITLPRTSPRLFCAAKRTGELRWVNKASACDGKEFPVLLAERAINVGSNPGDPVANDDDATTDEDHSVSISVIANDKNTPSTNSNAGLHVDSVNTTGTVGTVTVNPDDTITYDPNGKFEGLKAGQSATDSFRYKAKKGSHTSDEAIVTVTINGVNDAPVAKDDTAGTDSAHTTNIAVLSNDTDADGDPLTVASVDNSGTQGTVTINGDGTVKYDPGHAFDALTTGATAHDTFKYKANDGHVDSNAATVDVTVTGAEDPPVVTTTSGTVAYAENAAPTVIDGGVTVTDPDDTNLESAQVRISVNMEPGDTLDATPPAGIAKLYTPGTGVLSLTGSASKADYQAALRSVKFSSTHDNPAAAKTVEFKANDGDLDSNLATKGLTLTRVNDAPQLTTSGGNANFTEDSAATQVDAGITVADADSDQIQGAVASITANFSSADGDTLALNPSPQNGISGSYNSGTGVLTLTGTASKADYQTALGSITFSNTSNNPSTATRTVSFKVTDTSAAPWRRPTPATRRKTRR
jgi:VCBS repeat-containing protein